MFKSASDGAWSVYAIGTALIFVFGSLLKTDERRSSVMLWDWSANPKRHKSPICPVRVVGVEHRSPAFQLEQSVLTESLISLVLDQVPWQILGRERTDCFRIDEHAKRNFSQRHIPCCASLRLQVGKTCGCCVWLELPKCLP